MTLIRAKLRRVASHRLVHTAVALYALQIAHFVLPLVSIPYLARVLGAAELGAVFAAQSFATIVTLVIEYGFGLTATRDVARRQDDRDVVSRVVAGVLGAKLALTSIGLVATLVVVLVVPVFRDHPGYAWLAFAMAAAQALNPRWLFIGLERIKVTATLELACRALAVLLIVLLVRDEGEGQRVLAIWAVTALIPTLSISWMAYRVTDFRLPTLEASRTALAGGWHVFVGGAAVTLYTGANVFILGLLVPAARVPLFAGPEKVMRAATRLTMPLAAAVFPRMSLLVDRGDDARARRLARFTLGISLAVGLAGAVVLLISAPVVVDVVLGSDFEDATPVLRVLALTLPVIAITSVLHAQWLLPNHRDRDVSRQAMVVGVVNVVLAVVLVDAFGVIGMAWTCVAAEVLALGLSVWLVRRLRTAVPGPAPMPIDQRA